MKAKDPSELDRLRARIDDALRRERPRAEIMPLLERLLDNAPDHGELYVYGHRHTAELLLQDEPWRAALHLRRVIRAGAGEDTAHALMGLCQALLGNFDSAVFHYERALALDPSNAWYHHNLGHLLDVALNKPQGALVSPALGPRRASDGGRGHGLAGPLPRAPRTARGSRSAGARGARPLARARQSRIARGLDSQGCARAATCSVPSRPSTVVIRARAERKTKPWSCARSPTATARCCAPSSAACSPTARLRCLLSRAEQVWRDYRARRPNVRVSKPEVHAAALEYAVSVMHGITGLTQIGMAKRYGVSSAALASRYADIRSTLALEVGDPRYLH